jgi:hypothetical protein
MSQIGSSIACIACIRLAGTTNPSLHCLQCKQRPWAWARSTKRPWAWAPARPTERRTPVRPVRPVRPAPVRPVRPAPVRQRLFAQRFGVSLKEQFIAKECKSHGLWLDNLLERQTGETPHCFLYFKQRPKRGRRGKRGEGI